MTDLEMAKTLAQKIHEAGGTAYYVGGYVRDMLLGRENKDIDIEVHGIVPETLAGILSSFGELTSFGESFGIFGLRHYHLDIAMPRSERAVGSGHKDFICTVDPFIGTYRAALRRDFTINAMMKNILTGEIIDHFGGRKDLKEGIIRHIDSGHFAEDPLRVLRGAQFAARFRFQIAPETIKVCRNMDLTSLAPERVFCELEKALLKAERPSVFFEKLREAEQLTHWFPELESLIGIPQPPEYHPEGDAWAHTMLVADYASSMKELAENPIGLILSALCHDLGKARTTKIEKDGLLHAYGHDKAGVTLSDMFLSRITHDKKLRLYVKNMVELHMLPNMMALQHAGNKSFNKLFDRSVSPSDLLLLSKADALGSLVSPETYHLTEALLRDQLANYEAVIATPAVTGADLVSAGFKPGAAFHDALQYAHQLQLSGVDRKNALPQVIAYLRRLEKESCQT